MSRSSAANISTAPLPWETRLEPGQPVIAEGIIPDRVCEQCVHGHTNLCLVYDELGFTRAGPAADQVRLPAQVVHVLVPQVSLLDVAMAEPAAVAWRAIGRGRPRPGERIAVVGDGTLALITAHLLTLFSPADLVVCSQRPAQSGLAAEMGATGFELGSATSRFDLVIEAAGTASAVERALGLARRGGRVVLVGLAGNGVKAAVPIDDVVHNDLLISASFAYTSAAWAEVTALLSSAQIRLSRWSPTGSRLRRTRRPTRCCDRVQARGARSSWT